MKLERTDQNFDPKTFPDGENKASSLSTEKYIEQRTIELDQYISETIKIVYLDLEGDFVQDEKFQIKELFKTNLNFYSDALTEALTEKNISFPEELNETLLEHLIEWDLLKADFFYTCTRPPKFCLTYFPIGELEIEIPKEFFGIPSTDYHIKISSAVDQYSYAYSVQDEILCFVIDTENLSEHVDQVLEENAPHPENVFTLLLDSRNGIYIPKLFLECFSETQIERIKKQFGSGFLDGLEDPEDEFYWETWEHVLNNFELTHKETKYTLHQDGDLWFVDMNELESYDQGLIDFFWENLV